MSAVRGTPTLELSIALDQIASGAGERDSEPAPRFPDGPIALLERAGALRWNAFPGKKRPPAAEELGLEVGWSAAMMVLAGVFLFLGALAVFDLIAGLVRR